MSGSVSNKLKEQVEYIDNLLMDESILDDGPTLDDLGGLGEAKAWALDLVTALLLFLILGRRWAILPGLVAEAIPGFGIFPAWILVVGSIILYDDIKKVRTK